MHLFANSCNQASTSINAKLELTVSSCFDRHQLNSAKLYTKLCKKHPCKRSDRSSLIQPLLEQDLILIAPDAVHSPKKMYGSWPLFPAKQQTGRIYLHNHRIRNFNELLCIYFSAERLCSVEYSRFERRIIKTEVEKKKNG